MMKTKFEMSMGELYALSPMLRNATKNQLASENSTHTYVDDEDSVAAISKPLRAIYPEIGDDKIIAECVIDSGSEIVGIRRDVWMKIGRPMLT